MERDLEKLEKQFNIKKGMFRVWESRLAWKCHMLYLFKLRAGLKKT
jgi:hypothetical protein